MANQMANPFMKRLAHGTIPAQRCGCSMAAGPSVIKQVVNAQRRNLHSTMRAQEGASRTQRSAPRQHSDGIAASSRSSKTAVSADLEATGSSAAQQTQTRQSPSSLVKTATVLDLEDSKSTEKSATEVLPSTRPSFSFARPKQHPMTRGNQVCTLHLSSYGDDVPNLTFFTQFCVHAAYAFGLPCTLPAFLPTKSSLRTVPRSPFVHKPSQENFVKKEHKRQLKIFDSDIGVVGQWIDYISENSMSGVRIKATMWENKPVAFGKQIVGDTKDLESTEAQKVKEMAESLLAAGFGDEGVNQTSENDTGKAEEAAVETAQDEKASK